MIHMLSGESIPRRALLEGLGLLASTGVTSALAAQQPGHATGKVIDCHGHLYHHSHRSWHEADRKVIEAADKLGIDQLCCSIPCAPSTPQAFRECNQWVADGMRRFPGRVLGYCYVNPGYGREALEEIRRSIEERGFAGVKLYNEYRITDPVVQPVIELATELRVPILHHAGHAHYPIGQPNISDGGHLAEVSGRYPEAMFICAHIGGGGDWEWTIKALRHVPTVYLDTSGSVIDEGMIEMATRVLGVDRLVFGCDMSFSAGLGKLRGASLSAADKQKILGGNMQRILSRRGA